MRANETNIQIWVPKLAAKRALDLATREGISRAAWLRRHVLHATGVDGRGRDLSATAVEKK